MEYIAHIDSENNVQTVKQHCEKTACICKEFSISPLKELMYFIGLLHDIGKYQGSFQKRIRGDSSIHIEHSVCGAQVAKESFNSEMLALLPELVIAGHHSGIPDCGDKNQNETEPTLYARLKRKTEDYSIFESELCVPKPDENKLAEFIARDCKSKEYLVSKYAFLVRYCFSCLTDADSIDTAIFCNGEILRSLSADFEQCLEKLKKHVSKFHAETPLQKARSILQEQVYGKINTDAEIYLMNMPTGSGKTLCSMRFALERAVKTGKKRIIYVIPYNSIIEQTADTFEKVFEESAEILRHQSTFSYDDIPDISEDYKKTAKLTAENWDAKIVITTAVQFFESVYSNKRSKLRKLHNMADSIIIFDEAHMMPVENLQPCLEAISYITKYLNSEALFLTATMPDFKALIEKYTIGNKIVDLIDDKSDFRAFNKCRYENLGEISDMCLIERARQFASSLIVVNKRKTASELYKLCRESCRCYHLSTYMTAIDRKRVIADIKSELTRLYSDYPEMKDVPEDRRIVVISTSLIEAGVDLDFTAAFRELRGLDNILQTGGRCNREGKREDAVTYIFKRESERGNAVESKDDLTNGVLKEFEDISSAECIKAYYDRYFASEQMQITKNSIANTDAMKENPNPMLMELRSYAENFEMIASNTISIVVPRDDISAALIDEMKITGKANSRKLQKYSCSVYRWEFDKLKEQGVIDDYNTGIYCLTNLDYYDDYTGIRFEGDDYII